MAGAGSGGGRLLVVTTFVLALVGVVLGFASFRRTEQVALGMAEVDVRSAAQVAARLEEQARRIEEQEKRIAALEAQVKALSAPSGTE